MTLYTGKTAALSDCYITAMDARRVPTAAIRLWPRTENIDDAFVAGTFLDVLLTSFFVPIDLGRGLMYLDQSYSGLATHFPVRFQVDAGTYRLDSEPIRSAGRHVVIGGPVDGVWYHWLFNWCPRILLLRQMRPDLFAAEDVRFVVHPRALEQPFRAILDTFHLDERRFLVIDPGRDYRLEEACLVSFPDQDKLFPRLIQDFSRHLSSAFGLDPAPRNAGLFASRQALAPPKRRIANFRDIEPVLTRFGLRISDMATLPAREQAKQFHDANLIVGAHGSDLSNILFCRRRTPVVVIENRFSVENNLHMGLLKLAEILDLDYHLVVAGTTDEKAEGFSTIQRINRDYIVDPACLSRKLEGLRPRWPLFRRWRRR